MPMTFKQMVQQYCPPWLQGTNGAAFVFTFASQIDEFSEALKQGIRDRMPGLASDDALQYIGRDRLMPRGPGESKESYQYRLQRAFDLWAVAGNAATLIRELSVVTSFLGTPATIRTVTQMKSNGNSVWHKTTDGQTVTKYVTNPGWDWDGNTSEWSRLWIIIDAASAGITKWQIGDPGVIIGDGHTIGSNMTRAQVQTIRTVARSWLAAHTLLPNIIVDFSAGFSETNPGANPTTNWNYPPNRNPGAIYIDG